VSLPGLQRRPRPAGYRRQVRTQVPRPSRFGPSRFGPAPRPGSSLGLPPVRRGPAARGAAGAALRRAAGPRSPLRHLDWILLAAVLALSLTGTLLVWSATQSSLLQAGLSPRTYLIKQLLNIMIGLTFMVTVSTLAHRQLRLYAPFLYAGSCLGLLVVLTPLGSVVNGAHSWISLPGGFQIEPSEFAKIAVLLLVAMALCQLTASAPGTGLARPGLRAALLAIAAAALPIVLVEAEPDLGVIMLMITILMGMIAASGLRLRWLAALVAAGALAVYAVIALHLLKAYQLSRLTSFLNPAADPRGTGYSAAQAKIAIGSGGLFGQGLFHGQLIAGNFVPEQHTDFIFAVAGEELGFAGAALIIGLLAVVLLRALRIAARADDQFGTLIAVGIAIWFAVQAFINIGMTVGIMPVTGLPLPFVSYGGSAMFADMIAIGMLQSVHRRRTLFGTPAG